MVDISEINDAFTGCISHDDYATGYFFLKDSHDITENDEIYSIIRNAEERDVLGALYIVEKYEGTLASKYYTDFVKRRQQEIIDNLSEDKRRADDFRILYLCLTHLNDDERQTLCKKMANVYGEDAVTCAQTFGEAVNGFPDWLPWGRTYTKVAKQIYQSLGENDLFIKIVESILRDKKFILISEEDENNAYDFYQFLCKKELYETAVHFLNHYEIRNTFLGKNMEEVINEMYSSPSPMMVSAGRWFKRTQIDSAYYYEEWEKDVRKFNQDPEILNWLDVTMFFYRLNLYQEQGLKKEFEDLLEKASDLEMFDINKNRYLRRLSWDYLCIVNRMILSDAGSLLHFLEQIKKINFNVFSLAEYSYNSNIQSCKEGNFDYRDIEKALFDRFSVKDAMYIYMNTHLKHAIRLESVIRRLSDMGENISEAFKPYPLEGEISEVDVKASVRNKIFITPKNIAHDLDYHKLINATQVDGDRVRERVKNIRSSLIRTSEEWYVKNKQYAELARIKDDCTFYIAGYEKGSGIFAVDVTLPEDVVNERNNERNNVYPNQLTNWLNKIIEQKKNIPWDDEKKVYSTAYLEQDKRDEIAIEILRAAEVLANDSAELNAYINSLCVLPLEDANECRYIHSQKGLRFSFSGTNYKGYIREAKEISERIMSSPEISDSSKYSVFINTCMKKYYDFEKACEHIGNMLYFDAEKASKDPFYEPFYMWLSYEGENDQYLSFSTKIKLKKQLCNICFSHSEFRFKGDQQGIEKRKGYVYQTILESYDKDEKCFWIKEIVLKKARVDKWNRYMRLVIDLKNSVTDEAFEKTKKALADYNQYTKSEDRVGIIANELEKAFESQHHEMANASRILKALGKSNPFSDMSNRLENLEESFRSEFSDSYKKFMEVYHNTKGSPNLFCDVYFNSFLRVAVPRNTFFEDIAGTDEDKEKIIGYCRFKGYIE